MESETHLCREAVIVERDKVLKESCTVGRTCSYEKLFTLKNDTINADNTEHLMIENL